MVALARIEAGRHPELVTVQERGWEAIDEEDAYDVAVALGRVRLRGRARRAAAAPWAGPPPTSWPRSRPRGSASSCAVCATAPGVCTSTATRPDDLAPPGGGDRGLVADELRPLGRAGYLAHFARAGR